MQLTKLFYITLLLSYKIKIKLLLILKYDLRENIKSLNDPNINEMYKI